MADLSFSNPYQSAIDSKICYICSTPLPSFVPLYCGCDAGCCTNACSCETVPINVPICDSCKETV